MAAATPTTPATGWSRLADVVLPVTFVGALLVFIVPVPPGVLDLLLAANITLAVLVLLTTLSVRSPHEFSAFPTILLATTLTRLVLNVATTRLTLTRAGTNGLDAAGGVIRAFGEFVAGDQVVVGVIIFTIIFVIQFVVITRGSTRISEVAARFMLDGLPGRQMAIDADLHAGLIDQHEAHRRRERVHRQADFFGAMDGAGKFVRGDAVAGVFITLVNIGAGLFLGVVNYGMSFGQAVEVFTKLTIGDGLVSQVPALLTALAAGLIVTRSSEDSDLGRDVVGQLLGRPAVLTVAAVFLAMLAFTALPKLPLLSLAAALGTAAYLIRARDRTNTAESKSEPAPAPAPAEPPADRMDDLLHVDPLELEVGYRLIGLVDPTRGGDLLDRIRAMRHRVAQDLGLIVPQVRIRDEIALGPHDYRLKIRGTVVGQGIAYAGRLLAVPPAGLVARPDGRDGVDPTTGRPAVWIHADGRDVAELAGCRVIEASAVVAGHFVEVVLGHADELMTREQVGRLLDRARATSPTLVDEVVPGLLRAGEVQQVLQNLLRERVSVRDLETILETLAVHAGKTRDAAVLTEYARQGLARRIVQGYLGKDGRLRVVTLSPAVDELLVAVGLDDTRPDAALGGEVVRNLVRAVAQAVAPLVEAGVPAIAIASPQARPVLKDLTRADLPRLVVLSQREIPRDTPVEECGMVAEDDAADDGSAATMAARSA